MTHPDAEWIETDGLGGFASGTVSGIRTRRYHALLLPALTPPTGRLVLVNGFEAWVETPAGSFSITSQRYAPGVVHPDGASRIERFEPDPWPRWTFRLPDGTAIVQEIFARDGSPTTVVTWKRVEGSANLSLSLRPLLSGRDYHALHRENPGFRFDAGISGERVVLRPYAGLPAVTLISSGGYTHAPDWYRNFLYAGERARGLDFVEDLASPGTFRFDLSRGEAILVLGIEDREDPSLRAGEPVAVSLRTLRAAEKRRRGRFATRLDRSSDAYLVRRGSGRTIVAGYPWFTDWGRDTFIAMRGLCLATGRLDEAEEILAGWSGTVSEGMLPNRFPDRGESPEFNSVDASLWYVIAVHEFLEACESRRRTVDAKHRDALHEAVESILHGYARGTRYGIRLDADGLIAAGQPGVQLTWMDAKVGDWVVTPRIGKPVEVQALWLNALRIGSASSPRWRDIFERGRESFVARFWDESGRRLHDVVDVDHRPGTVDPSFRPNQIFAAGGLPFALLDGPRARAVVDAVEAKLLTPVGLRSLSPDDPRYAPRYEGGVRGRDGAYHQGTVWPWLLGAFVDAWVRARGGSGAAKKDARARYLGPLLRHLDDAGLGHLPEIADGDPPHTPRGCPFQAWSLGEALRLDRVVLAEGTKEG